MNYCDERTANEISERIMKAYNHIGASKFGKTFGYIDHLLKSGAISVIRETHCIEFGFFLVCHMKQDVAKVLPGWVAWAYWFSYYYLKRDEFPKCHQEHLATLITNQLGSSNQNHHCLIPAFFEMRLISEMTIVPRYFESDIVVQPGCASNSRADIRIKKTSEHYAVDCKSLLNGQIGQWSQLLDRLINNSSSIKAHLESGFGQIILRLKRFPVKNSNSDINEFEDELAEIVGGNAHKSIYFDIVHRSWEAAADTKRNWEIARKHLARDFGHRVSMPMNEAHYRALRSNCQSIPMISIQYPQNSKSFYDNIIRHIEKSIIQAGSDKAIVAFNLDYLTRFRMLDDFGISNYLRARVDIFNKVIDILKTKFEQNLFGCLLYTDIPRNSAAGLSYNLEKDVVFLHNERFRSDGFRFPLMPDVPVIFW